MISIPERLKLPDEPMKRSFDNFDFDLRCASPGIIQAFDPETQTVEVQLAINERIKIDGVESNETVPILVDVPIVIPQVKGYSLTFPIEIGDECLVIFSDTCFDAWFQSGGIQNQMSLRRHDLSDGFAIIGVKSQPNVIPDYSSTTVQLRDNTGTNFLELGASSIRMVFGSSEVKLSSDSIDITGPAVNINSSGNTVIEDRNFLEHQHENVEKGTSNSGGVV